jgi:hypothetical protein
MRSPVLTMREIVSRAGMQGRVKPDDWQLESCNLARRVKQSRFRERKLISTEAKRPEASDAQQELNDGERKS